MNRITCTCCWVAVLVAALAKPLVLPVTTHAQTAADRPAVSTPPAGPLPPLHFQVPARWEYTAPLIAPEPREREPSHAQKDPSVVFHDGKWHVFMTVKLPARSAIEYCCVQRLAGCRTVCRGRYSQISDSDYYCAPQVFYFTPHKKWYLIYQVGVAGSDKMWVAYSTTADLDDPRSWTTGPADAGRRRQDPRPVGGLDYWIICDTQRAYLFLTNLNGQMWRLWTRLEDFPRGFARLRPSRSRPRSSRPVTPIDSRARTST